MDERDYKAMNDELKILSKCGITFGLTNSRDQCLNAMREYASQFKKQLKEKDKQLTKSNEMNEMLAGQIGLFLNFGGKEHLEEALEQYQNSKK